MAELSAADALTELLAGNQRFVDGQPRYGHDASAAAAASGDQRPIAVLLGCIDSRVPLEAVFDQGFGAICVVRSGGHVLDRAVLGSVEFAVTALRVPLVMVLGHSRCGAVQATMDVVRGGAHRPAGPLSYLVDEIAPAVRATVDEPTTLAVTRTHVARTVERLRPLAAGAMVTGAVYDLDSRRVGLLD
jgi:carbonic anhydrase